MLVGKIPQVVCKRHKKTIAGIQLQTDESSQSTVVYTESACVLSCYAWAVRVTPAALRQLNSSTGAIYCECCP